MKIKIICLILSAVTALSCFSVMAFAYEKNGLQKLDGYWYYYKNDAVDYSFKGLAKNDYGWWYVQDGKIDYNYVGLAKNEYGWFYVKNGRIDYGFSGLAKNQYGWFYVKNGKIDYTFTGMAKNDYGWWYVNKGKLNKEYEGLAKNEYGWWYLDGSIDYKFEGLAKNDYGWWYIRNGRIDFSYNGKAKNDYGWWNVKNGKLTNSVAKWNYSYALDTPNLAESDSWNLLLVNRDYMLPDGFANNISLSYVCGSGERLDSRAAPFYEKMYNAAAKEGIYLTPCSGYRTYDRQKTNFENRIARYQSQGYSKKNAALETSKVILPPGTSEHNAGLAMDIVCVEDWFETTAAFRWLCNNAQDYGFILRYPKDKQDITEIIYEPWHWRYVGVDTAKAMKKSGQCLEEYLNID